MSQPFPADPFFAGNYAPLTFEADAPDLPLRGALPKNLAGTPARRLRRAPSSPATQRLRSCGAFAARRGRQVNAFTSRRSRDGARRPSCSPRTRPRRMAAPVVFASPGELLCFTPFHSSSWKYQFQ
jgi:hypothetical protein